LTGHFFSACFTGFSFFKPWASCDAWGRNSGTSPFPSTELLHPRSFSQESFLFFHKQNLRKLPPFSFFSLVPPTYLLFLRYLVGSPPHENKVDLLLLFFLGFVPPVVGLRLKIFFQFSGNITPTLPFPTPAVPTFNRVFYPLFLFHFFYLALFFQLEPLPPPWMAYMTLAPLDTLPWYLPSTFVLFFNPLGLPITFFLTFVSLMEEMRAVFVTYPT